MNSISLSANPFHESLSFSILMFFMQSSAMEGLLKYLSISLLMASGVPSAATRPVPLSPIVSFNPPTSVTIIGTYSALCRTPVGKYGEVGS